MNDITRKAILRAGGPTVVARACVPQRTRQAVSQWKVVPPEHCLVVERLSGISRYELRPDIYGPKPSRDDFLGDFVPA